MTTTLLLGYIDPTSGVFLLQILVAALLGGIAYFRQAVLAVPRLLFRTGTPRPQVECSPEGRSGKTESP